MDAVSPTSTVVPFSLKDASSLIERVWPAQKISVEVQKERKAVQGQTITTLGTYWKGRKPLSLVRACILGALLPSTGNDAQDLRIFELLMGMDDDQILDRLQTAISTADVKQYGNAAQQNDLLSIEGKSVEWRQMPRDRKFEMMAGVVANMPYLERVEHLVRPEELPDGEYIKRYLGEINAALSTTATSLEGLVAELGIMRFGHTPKVGDTFSGGGSIPFEAARIGCESYGSDLNPVACMLTWGDLNIVGTDQATRAEITAVQRAVRVGVDEEIKQLKIEHDDDGNRAKAFLYCLETRCPQTGWLVPLSSTWIVSKTRRVVAQLRPNKKEKRFDISIKSDATDTEMKAAATGTAVGGAVVYELNGETYRTPIKTLRGDFRREDGSSGNKLRLWEKEDFVPRPDDVFRERLYCIQWMRSAGPGKRSTTFFAAPSEDDLRREEKVEKLVRAHIKEWQELGLIPDMAIEPGDETSRLLRERGWSHWHHLFSARQLHMLATTRKLINEQSGVGRNAVLIGFAKSLDWGNRCCYYGTGAARESISHLFYNQAFNTFVNYGVRATATLLDHIELEFGEPYSTPLHGDVECKPAAALARDCDIFVTDPPYADAVNYHEITEFFIAWLRKNPPPPFGEWTWDSRRPLAIKGDGEAFRKNMVEAYSAMTSHMPENGMQIVMFTHQSASVWADMAQIFWGAGLQVMAAWYIATETTSELKKGGYVQGTVILVLRKRKAKESGYKDEIVQEVRAEVADQIDTMVGLNQSLKGRGRIENLFEDADLQMAGYAAALRVLTRYEKIDGMDMTQEAVRPRRSAERNIVGEIIDFAVQVANEHMVPEHMQSKLWEGLSGSERFYFKMMDIETTSLRKLDNYQNFAKAFRVDDYGALMGSMEPNKARLKTAKEFKKAGFEIEEFGASPTRAVLYAVYELVDEVEGDEVLAHLRDMVPSYHSKRDDLAAIAEYIARKREKVDETESRAARILHGLIRNERLG